MAVATLALKSTRPASRQVSVLPPVPVEMLRRFSVDEYHHMIANGTLNEDDPYELLEGWIIRKMAIDPIHAYAVSTLAFLLSELLSKDWFLRTQQPITSERSEPEPDICVAPGPRTKYRTRHPSPLETELLIEVANSSLATDRGNKMLFYASAGVPQYWIVNLIDHRVEVYTQPRGGKKPGYKSCVHYAKCDEIPLVLAKKKVGSLPVSEFLA